MKKIAVLTSGGDAPGMNACIRSVVRTGLKQGLQVFGVYRGYQGLVEDDMVEMDQHSVSNIIQQGGTVLYSARSDEFRTIKGRIKAHEHLKSRGIDGLIVIGGDGTFAGAHLFYQEFDFPVIGIPGTIDNDLNGTDYTIGYDTAINTAMDAVDKIKDTAHAHNRLFFIEVMGRDAGFIALRTGISTGAEAVLIPETRTDIDQLIKVLENNYNNKKRSSIVIVAEGDDEGGAFEIAKKVENHCFNSYEMRVSILGHLQRGGRPTCSDRVLASRLGMEAVHALQRGEEDVMVGQVHLDVVLTPLENASKHHHAINPLLLEMVEYLG